MTIVAIVTGNLFVYS